MLNGQNAYWPHVSSNQSIRMLKSGHVLADNNELDDLQKRLRVLPISSAQYERAFTSMNQRHTPKRNDLQITMIRDLLFVKLNGLPLELWIKQSRHSATDNSSGRAAKESRPTLHHHKLFLL